MKFNYLLALAFAVSTVHLLPVVAAEDPEDTGVQKEMRRRQENASKLSVEEQLKLRAAQQKAMDDPQVKAALEKRDKAVLEFREKLRAAMITSDPSVQPILDKVASGTNRGF